MKLDSRSKYTSKTMAGHNLCTVVKGHLQQSRPKYLQPFDKNAKYPWMEDSSSSSSSGSESSNSNGGDSSKSTAQVSGPGTSSSRGSKRRKAVEGVKADADTTTIRGSKRRKPVEDVKVDTSTTKVQEPESRKLVEEVKVSADTALVRDPERRRLVEEPERSSTPVRSNKRRRCTAIGVSKELKMADNHLIFLCVATTQDSDCGSSRCMMTDPVTSNSRPFSYSTAVSKKKKKSSLTTNSNFNPAQGATLHSETTLPSPCFCTT
jgi:hypothetical protein